MTEDPKLPVTAAVTAAALPENFTVQGVVVLARDLAIGLYDEDVILQKSGVTPEQYETLKKIPYFQQLVEQQAKDWNRPQSAQQRLALQTTVGLEAVLPEVIARAHARNEPLASVAQLIKVLADIAGVTGQVKQQSAPTEKFKITINLGADAHVYEKSKPIVILDSGEYPTEMPPVEEIRSGLSSLLTLQTQPEAKGSSETIRADSEGA